jgi:hypothetical protein
MNVGRLIEGLNDSTPVIRDGVKGIASSAMTWGTSGLNSIPRKGISSTWRSGWSGN